MKDLAFIGRLGKTELGAAALGNTVFYLMHYPMVGAMTAIDTLLATTFGAGLTRAYGDWTQVAMVVMTALTILVMVLMLFVGELLEGIGQSRELSRLAGK